MLASIASLSAMLAMVLAAFGLGRWVVRLGGLLMHARRRADGDNAAIGRDPPIFLGHDASFGAILWSFSIGLVASGVLLLVVGLCGQLDSLSVLAATTAAAFFGAFEISMSWADWLERRRGRSPRLPLRSSGNRSVLVVAVMLGMAAIAVLCLLLAGLLPPTSADAAARLELPKRWLVEGRLSLPAGTSFSGELLSDAWSVWALALCGGEAARLFHWVALLWFAAATVELATPLLGRQLRWAAVAVVVLTPAVIHETTTLGSVVAASACATLAVVAWRNSLARAGRRWAALAGVFLAVTAALGAVPALILAVVLMIALSSRRATANPTDTLPAVHIAAALAGFVAVGSGLLLLGCLARGQWHMSRLPAPECAWPLAGASLLAVSLLPGLLLARPIDGFRPMLVAVAAYGLLTAPLAARADVQLPALPVLAVATVWVLQESRRMPRWPRRIVSGSCLAGLLVVLASPLAILPEAMPVVFGQQDRDDYLTDREPDWPAAAVASRLLRPTDCLLSQAEGSYHFNCRMVSDRALCAWAADNDIAIGREQPAVSWRGAGFSHVLLVDDPDWQNNWLGRQIELQAARQPQSLCVLADFHRAAPDGRARRYRLIWLR